MNKPIAPEETDKHDLHPEAANHLSADNRADFHLGKGAGWASLTAAACAGIALAGMMLLMLGDVVGRYWFNSPIPGASEFIEMGMAITVFAALPLVTLRGEHIQLDYLIKALRGRFQSLLDTVIHLISAGGMGLIAWRLVLKTETVIAYHDTTPFLRLPTWPVATLITLCAGISALIFLAKALQLLGTTITGRALPASGVRTP